MTSTQRRLCAVVDLSYIAGATIDDELPLLEIIG